MSLRLGANARVLAARGALRVHVQRIETMAGGHEQTVPPRPPNTVGRPFRQRDMADRLRRRLKIRTPSSAGSPMPQPHHRLPWISTRNPSGEPGPASMNTRLLRQLRAPTTSNARISRFGCAREATT